MVHYKIFCASLVAHYDKIFCASLVAHYDLIFLVGLYFIRISADDILSVANITSTLISYTTKLCTCVCIL